MASTLQKIDNITIENDIELAFQEQIFQALLSKKMDLQYGVSDIISMIAAIVALGAMVISLTATSNSNLAVFILAVCLLYGIYGLWKQHHDKHSLNDKINVTFLAISSYKTCKEKINLLPNTKSQEKGEN